LHPNDAAIQLGNNLPIIPAYGGKNEVRMRLDSLCKEADSLLTGTRRGKQIVGICFWKEQILIVNEEIPQGLSQSAAQRAFSAAVKSAYHDAFFHAFPPQKRPGFQVRESRAV